MRRQWPRDSMEAGGTPLPSVDTYDISERDYSIVRAFLERRGSLAAPSRMALATQIAGVLRRRVGGGSQLPDEELLEALARSYRERFAPSPPPGQPPIPPAPEG
jgi:hypothetical protein